MKDPKTIFDVIEELEKSKEKETDFSSKISFFLKTQAREKGIPYHGHFELTPLCNLNCKMCYVHLNKDQLNKELLTANDWIMLMQQAIDAGMVLATLSGGECLTYPFFGTLFMFLSLWFFLSRPGSASRGPLPG